MREAGCTAAQEVGFTLANGIAYVQAAIDNGLDVDAFAPRVSFFFDSHLNFFEEIAKFRAARRLWARIMKERFGAKDQRSWMLRFHTQTAGCTLTAQQPYNNIVRTAIEALAAILGGTQSLHTNSFDEAYWTPSEEAVTIAVRTQQLLAYENGVADVVDPAGGSYYLESLTNKLEKQAVDYIAKIDDFGGAVAAIEQGYQQREIQQSSYKYQRMVEEGKQKIVGVNDFVTGESRIASTLRVKQEMEAKQKGRLAKLKKERDNGKAKQTLSRLEEVAQGKGNTMPAIIECVEAYATIGEICDVLRNVFGVQREFLFF